MKMAITAMYIIILPKSIVNDSLNKCYDFRYILCYPGQTVSRKDLQEQQKRRVTKGLSYDSYLSRMWPKQSLTSRFSFMLILACIKYLTSLYYKIANIYQIYFKRLLFSLKPKEMAKMRLFPYDWIDQS